MREEEAQVYVCVCVCVGRKGKGGDFDGEGEKRMCYIMWTLICQMNGCVEVIVGIGLELEVLKVIGLFR